MVKHRMVSEHVCYYSQSLIILIIRIKFLTHKFSLLQWMLDFKIDLIVRSMFSYNEIEDAVNVYGIDLADYNLNEKNITIVLLTINCWYSFCQPEHEPFFVNRVLE